VADAGEGKYLDLASFLDLQMCLRGPDVVAETGDGDPGNLHGAFVVHGMELLVEYLACLL
jgi:hypothetical protein